MKQYVVTSSVPTAYQMTSIYQLMGGGNVKNHMDGSLSARVICDTKDEAIEFLKSRIDVLFEDHGTEEEYAEMIAALEKYERVSWDAATARIIEEEVVEDEEE